MHFTLSADGRAFLSNSFAWAVCTSGKLRLDVIFDFTLHDVEFRDVKVFILLVSIFIVFSWAEDRFALHLHSCVVALQPIVADRNVHRNVRRVKLLNDQTLRVIASYIDHVLGIAIEFCPRRQWTESSALFLTKCRVNCENWLLFVLVF